VRIIDDRHPAVFTVGPLMQTVRQRLHDYLDASTDSAVDAAEQFGRGI
jgi:hypothetical protein